ncbi:MAG: electron transfer flavoprotein subunit alpha/FixB family protein, partial [Myxococcota bacterium]|nr:electron transfer flavoprotein subunit alpha/FixB family protein [Myxococcota bacterium]
MGNILIVTEIQNGAIREASSELAAVAQGLAESTGRSVKSLVIGSGCNDLASDFASKGGGDTLVVDD